MVRGSLVVAFLPPLKACTLMRCNALHCNCKLCILSSRFECILAEPERHHAFSEIAVTKQRELSSTPDSGHGHRTWRFDHNNLAYLLSW